MASKGVLSSQAISIKREMSLFDVGGCTGLSVLPVLDFLLQSAKKSCASLLRYFWFSGCMCSAACLVVDRYGDWWDAVCFWEPAYFEIPPLAALSRDDNLIVRRPK